MRTRYIVTNYIGDTQFANSNNVALTTQPG